MQEEENPIKKILFEYVKEKEETYQKEISQNRFSSIIDDILVNCYDKISSMAPKEESVGTLAIGILHYLLTNSLIPSQRKIQHKGMEVDIIIPDLRTLEEDPKKSLVIFIAKVDDKQEIQSKIDELKKIQPIDENIWVILGKKEELGIKTFVLQKENASFSNIIYEIGKFVNVNGQNKLKILRIN